MKTLVSKLTLNNATQQQIALDARIEMVKQHMVMGHNENVVTMAQLMGWGCVVITDCNLIYVFDAIDNNNMNVYYVGSVKQDQTHNEIINAYKLIASL